MTMTLLVNVELLLQDMAWPISIMEDLNGASKGMTMTLLVNVDLLLPGHGMAHQHHGRLKRGLQRNEE
ncbi:hypothetical protein M8J76_003352 [Diaphorina citri]|nr:hypothetical protein M8J76_003352 [Diaphorina citri]